MRAFLLFFFLFSSALKAPLQAELAVQVTAQSAILMDAESGKILYQKNAFKRAYPASTTKVATALYVLEKGSLKTPLDFAKKVIGSAEALGAVHPEKKKYHPPHRLEFGATHIGIKPGEELSYDALMQGLLIASAGDAANILAESMSGSIPQFMEEMNAYLKGLGTKDTNFTNPHGLHDPNHYSTAYDLALITKAALEYPYLCDIAKKVKFERPETNKQAATIFPQSNRLLRPGKFYYPKTIGFKTGYTGVAKSCLISAAIDENRSLIAVVLGSPESALRFQDTIALFEAAFNEKKQSKLLYNKDFETFIRQEENAAKPICAVLAQNAEVSYYPSLAPQFKPRFSWDVKRFPVQALDKVGTLEIVDTTENEKVFQRIDLLAKEDVPASFKFKKEQFYKQCGLLWKKQPYLIYLFILSLLISIFICCKKQKKIDKVG